jgi:adenosylcobinamide-phosphate synthase
MDAAMGTSLAILAGALLWDACLGEYPALAHPVVWIGKLVTLLLRCAPRQGFWRPFVFGVFLAGTVPALGAAVALGALYLVADIPVLQIAVGIFLLKASFALRELGAAARRVRTAVEAGDLPRAREALRSLCSRDPTHLDGEALLTAAVQSIAENLGDSFVAPLFYFVLFGVPGAVAYRAINTLDAMVGYRGPFEALGKASARLDDVANWLPARLTAALLLLAGWIAGQDVKGGWRIFRRDRKNTPSPNGGRPMAMMAGLLGVQLEKKGAYILGDRDRPVMPTTAQNAWRVARLAAWLAVILSAIGIAGSALLRHGWDQAIISQPTPSSSVSSVIGTPTRQYSQNEIVTPSRRAVSTTMRLATDPSTVRLPARVLDIARASHAVSRTPSGSAGMTG